MEFEKQLNRIKKRASQSVYLFKERTDLQELVRKVFGHHCRPEDQDLERGRFNMDEVSVQTAPRCRVVPFFETVDWRLIIQRFLTGEGKNHRPSVDRLQAYLEIR